MANNLSEIMGHRLRMLRTHFKYSQEEFAEKVNAHRVYITEWETGKKPISTQFLCQIGDVFHLPWDFFNPNNPDYLDHLKGPLKKKKE